MLGSDWSKRECGKGSHWSICCKCKQNRHFSMPSDEYEHVAGVDAFYVCESVPGPGCPEDADRIDVCECVSDCTDACHAFGPAYVTNAKGVSVLMSPPEDAMKPVFECHSLCRCDPDRCRNRVVANGPVDCLEVSRAAAKGLGLFAKKPLDAFSFVCEYASEYIGEQEALKRSQVDAMQGNMNYILRVHEHLVIEGRPTSITTIVDPTRLGNLGRYANHSCCPNTTVVPVRSDSWRLPRLALFTVRCLSKDEEITFDYGTNAVSSDHHGDNDDTGQLVVCRCGESCCRGYLPFHMDRQSPT